MLSLGKQESLDFKFQILTNPTTPDRPFRRKTRDFASSIEKYSLFQRICVRIRWENTVCMAGRGIYYREEEAVAPEIYALHL